MLGYLAAGAIGVTLGLMGGGGSILTVPVLVYLFGLSAGVATLDSLFVVGVTAALGAALQARLGQVDFPAALRFAIPAFLSVWLTRRVLVPALPERIGPVSQDAALLALFAVLMLATAVSMLRPRREREAVVAPARLVVTALAVGLVSGLVGAGGGFLIVPALTLAAGLPMKKAVATSLAIIAANSLFGFFADPDVLERADFGLLGRVTGLAGVGMTVGIALSRRIPGDRLRPAFGVFLLAMGTFVIGRELF